MGLEPWPLVIKALPLPMGQHPLVGSTLPTWTFLIHHQKWHVSTHICFWLVTQPISLAILWTGESYITPYYPIFLFFVLNVSAQHLLRTDPVEDKEGFFIALFTRNITPFSESSQKAHIDTTSDNLKHEGVKRQHHPKKFVRPLPFTKFTKWYLHRNSMIHRMWF